MPQRIPNAGQKKQPASNWRATLLDVFLAVVATRAVLLLAGLVALSRGSVDLAGVHAFHSAHLDSSRAVTMWVRWDAEWYLQIATHGYSGRLPGPPVFDMRPNFFPLYPIAIRLLGRVTGNPIVAGLVISNVALAAALLILHGWTSRRFDRPAARQVVWLYAVFPTSFFLSAVYAESLLLVSLVMAWRALEWRRWSTTGVFTAAALLCRPVGVIAAPAALLAAARDARWRPADTLRRALMIAAPVAIAVAAYVLLFAFVLHDPASSIRTETLTRATFRWPWTTLIDAWRNGLTWSSYDRPTLDWVLAVVAVSLIPVIILTLDAATALFATLMVLFPLTSGLYSYSRLLLPVFPLFVTIAARVPPRILTPMLVAGMALQVWLFVEFVRWDWVG